MKIEQSKELIRRFSNKSAVMCSFGKDSMALLYLVRNTLPMVPVIYHRHPWFPFKNEFADSIIRSWNLTVHDYPPVAAGVKAKDDRLELVSRYSFGEYGYMDLPMNTEELIPRREFVCGLDFITRPKSRVTSFPWKNVFIGHKSSDVDPYLGAVPLSSDTSRVGDINLVFPLRYWTDDDVWDYIESNHIPYDKRRYQNRVELEDKWLNPDYLNACTKCVDPRETATEVFCPKLNALVPNLGGRVLRLDHKPEYIKAA